MRDRRDYVIAALAGALLFCLGLLVGQDGAFLSSAQAQDGGGFDPTQPVPKSGKPQGPVGITIQDDPSIRPGFESRTGAQTASDSDSNNRFVAVTAPIGSGESVLFLIDAKTEQLNVYRYMRNKQGVMFLAGRKIDYDLKIKGWKDLSEFTRDEMKREYEKSLAREIANDVKNRKNNKGG